MIIDDLEDEIFEIVSNSTGCALSDDDREFIISRLVENNISKDKIIEYIKSNCADWFRVVSKPPSWIQNAVWPYHDNRPMAFVGHINVEKIFHDDAAFFIFWDSKTGVTETIIQVA